MKGTLHLVESGWVVWYGTPRTDNQNGSYLTSLPLHPDDIPTQAEDHFWIDGKEVDFEVVLEIPHDLEPTNGSTLGFEAVEYAKTHALYFRLRARREDQRFDPDAKDGTGAPKIYGKSPSRGDSAGRIVVTDKVPSTGVIVNI